MTPDVYNNATDFVFSRQYGVWQQDSIKIWQSLISINTFTQFFHFQKKLLLFNVFKFVIFSFIITGNVNK